MRAASGTVADPGSLGIVIGGSGNGEQMAANKIKGVRAALAWSEETARLARLHNNANVLSLGARMHSLEQAVSFALAFLATEFSGAPPPAGWSGSLTTSAPAGCRRCPELAWPAPAGWRSCGQLVRELSVPARVEMGAEPQVIGDAQLGIRRRVLGDEADPGQLRRAAGRLAAEDLDRA